MAHDAGSERNNELASHPRPRGRESVRARFEGGLIGPHAGILGVPGGIDAGMYDWDGNVVRITIERVS
jgi:hypothetical protein